MGIPYSQDGDSALAVFATLNGRHGGDWVYMLHRQGRRWEVVWRHLHNYE
jgi:hypothetical protein